MTLDELDAKLRDRSAVFSVSYLPDGVAVAITHQFWRPGKVYSGKSVTAKADKLEQAVEIALLRYDSRW